MPRWSARLIAELAEQDERIVSVAGDLAPETLNWRPRPESWSVGQCVEHLHVTNLEYLRPIEEAMAGQPQAPVEEITPGWFGRLFIRKYIDPSPSSGRSRAPGKITPTTVVEPSIVASFLDSNAHVREVILRARDLDVNRIRFRNPFVPLIRFTIGTGFEILARHQRRHLLQAERIRQAHSDGRRLY